MSGVLAYTYEADYHCPSCATERFGLDEHGFVPVDALDAEGNPIGALAPWEEWQQYDGGREILACGTCGDVIDEYEEDA